MAQKSGFFNALNNGGVYDRTYNAEDYCDNLAVVISSGVLRGTNDDLKVTANGLNLSVNAGRAWIKGHYYKNDSTYALPAVSAPTGGSRIDRVILRFDKTITVRSVTIQYLTGTAAVTPVAPALTRNDNIYDLCLAEITIAANATSVGVIDKRPDADLCGWVYSTSGDNSFFVSLDNDFYTWFNDVKDDLASVTLFKRYKWTSTLASAASSVTFSIPQYDPDTCFVEVYVNGMLVNNYTVSGSTITFSSQLVSGTQLTVCVYKSIDGTGIMSVSDEITQLQNQYATISGVSKLTYNATGQDDNVSLTQIAQAIYDGNYNAQEVTGACDDFLTALGGNTWLAALPTAAHITIEVVGKLGVTTPAYGSGTTQSRYRYFNLSLTGANDKRIIFDFAKAETIQITCGTGTANIIFYGTDLDIRNASVQASATGANTTIQMVAGSNVGRSNCETCRFEIDTTGDARIAQQGTFLNCDTLIKSSTGHALSFVPDSDDLIRVIGGTHRAYAKVSGKTAAIFYTYGTQPDAVIMATAINCPTVAVSGYWQQYLSVAYAGKTIIDMVTSTMNSDGTYNTITNQVWKSKTW